jgi:hypothetical protein
VIQYASTVWHGTQAEMQRLEQVQYIVLKRMAATHENIAAVLLNMEFGCRTYESWAMQRKLEFQFRLARLPAGRLPAIVSHCRWHGVPGTKKPAMHDAQVTCPIKLWQPAVGPTAAAQSSVSHTSAVVKGQQHAMGSQWPSSRTRSAGPTGGAVGGR